jgi:hypothetical protein
MRPCCSPSTRATQRAAHERTCDRTRVKPRCEQNSTSPRRCNKQIATCAAQQRASGTRAYLQRAGLAGGTALARSFHAGCAMLHGARCMLHVAFYALHTANCMLRVAWNARLRICALCKCEHGRPVPRAAKIPACNGYKACAQRLNYLCATATAVRACNRCRSSPLDARHREGLRVRCGCSLRRMMHASSQDFMR